MFHCYECDAQIEGPVWKSRCVACVVKKLEANLNENEELRKHLAAAEAIDDPNGQLVYYGDHKLIVEKLEKRLAEAEAKLTETENGLRWACNTYIVDDYYTGDLRNERLERAVRRVMVKVTGRV